MIIDLFVSKDGEAWRLYVAGWAPPTLRSWLDGYGERFPLPEPDLDALEGFMWKHDAPFVIHRVASRGAEITARGRSALVLSVWLEDWVRSADDNRRCHDRR